jgi:NAD(P)-dependent dehydrogenase (short-subunit alcohol dehydrogenase family)
MNNQLDFSGKVALVTGAAAGMGLATAQAFAEAGAAVVLADFKEDAVKAAAEKLVPAGHKALAIRSGRKFLLSANPKRFGFLPRACVA